MAGSPAPRDRVAASDYRPRDKDPQVAGEIRYTHQEDTLRHLDDAVVELRQAVEDLTRRVAALERRQRDSTEG